MRLRDGRGYEVSGATPGALDAFERALDLHLAWRTGVEEQLESALAQAPAFTMANILDAYLTLSSRDPIRLQRAQAAHARAVQLPATAQERLHVTAIAAVLADDFSALHDVMNRLIEEYPRDVLALQIGHAFDYLTGDAEAMAGRVSSVLSAWSQDLPGYHAVLAMQAFSLVESGRYTSGIDHGLFALELEPRNVRAHHALAHVYEMTGNAAAGIQWMRSRQAFWSTGTGAATHCWWHWALYHLTLGEVRRALEIYDRSIRRGRSPEIADLIDASALLWRIELVGGNVGRRWRELSEAWASHSEDGYCTFNDLHEMLAHAGSRDWHSAGRLEAMMRSRQARSTRYGQTTRLVGVPAGRAIIAFGRGEYFRAAQLLRELPHVAWRLGGSQAQRNLLDFTLNEALARSVRSTRAGAA
jgi:tetratricopeptide (TPR) repeat protein